MMSRCSDSHKVGACSCEMCNPQTNYISMPFSIYNGDHYCTRANFDEDHGTYSSSSAYSSSSVDCTLSLGTPSTRLTMNDNNYHYHQGEEKRSASKRMSNFGWNILQTKHTPSSSAAKNHRAGTNGNAVSGGDPLLARRCANCDTTSTPLWRNGPRGPKSLCNACGIRYKKEERRATSAAAAITTATAADNSSWVHSQKMGYYYGFVEMT